MKLVDTHTHSLFSSDSKMDIDAALQYTREAGLHGIVFTEHYDFDVPEGIIAFEFDPAEQQAAVREIAERYKTDITVLTGIEVGMQPASFDKIHGLLDQHTFDQIIASVHFVDQEDPYHGGYYIGKDAKRAYGRYLETIYNCIRQMKTFDILGHFDYIARYAPYPESMCYADFPDLFDAIFQLLIQHGRTLELNTKTYHIKPDGTPHPDPHIFRRFRELGGEALSFGSDAHKLEHIGIRFDEYAALAKEFGFRYSVYYQDRKPMFLPL